MSKRFTYLDYKDTVRDNETGKEYHTWYEDNLLDLLNGIADENEQLKQTIKEAYKTERTAIGKSVLKQLLDSL